MRHHSDLRAFKYKMYKANTCIEFLKFLSGLKIKKRKLKTFSSSNDIAKNFMEHY